MVGKTIGALAQIEALLNHVIVSLDIVSYLLPITYLKQEKPI